MNFSLINQKVIPRFHKQLMSPWIYNFVIISVHRILFLANHIIVQCFIVYEPNLFGEYILINLSSLLKFQNHKDFSFFRVEVLRVLWVSFLTTYIAQSLGFSAAASSSKWWVSPHFWHLRQTCQKPGTCIAAQVSHSIFFVLPSLSR